MVAKRNVERALAWGAVAVAGAAWGLAAAAPWLADGPPGPLGFAAEALAAMWFPVGVLVAAAASLLLCRRRWRPAAALLALALAISGPQAWRRLGSPLPSAGAEASLRLAAVNLCAENRPDQVMVDSLRRLDADVLVLSEFTHAWQAYLEPALAADYPHRWLAAAPEEPGVITDGLRIAIWSRVAAAGAPAQVHLGGRNAQIRVPLRVAGRTFALYGIHPWKPFPYGLWRTCVAQRRDLLQWLDGETLPMVVAGDFNAAPSSAFVAALRRRGLVHVGEQVLGYAPDTWPAQPASRAPFRVPIDHVMCSDALRPVGFARGERNGSDHWPIVVELAWAD